MTTGDHNTPRGPRCSHCLLIYETSGRRDLVDQRRVPQFSHCLLIYETSVRCDLVDYNGECHRRACFHSRLGHESVDHNDE
ncbi:hypothetical protein SCLCIDRAFT_296654 [Scleroderma citrinum Foug A]|uniref:Uncharacterized protein n=1 Tax=Scleroderma citrinum Foug A TaxID=1036808 RepID=A0A0C2Z0P3_9AGAM|nr:hypothetical protein SCLCIDRAFT_296654 [Scleroderma citrinum Foug A]